MFIFNQNINEEQELTDIILQDQNNLRTEYLSNGSTLDAHLNHDNYNYLSFTEKKDHLFLEPEKVVRVKRIFIIIEKSVFFNHLITTQANALDYIISNTIEKHLVLKPEEKYQINQEFFVSIENQKIVPKKGLWAPIICINHYLPLNPLNF